MSAMPAPPAYTMRNVRESLDAAMRDRARLATSASAVTTPDLVLLHPQTLETLIRSKGFGDPVDPDGRGGKIVGTSAVLWGVPVVASSRYVQDRCLWTWSTPATGPRRAPQGPPSPA